MLDIKRLIKNRAKIEQLLKKRDQSIELRKVLESYAKLNSLPSEFDSLR